MKPKDFAIEDTESDAILVLTEELEGHQISQPPSPIAAREVVLVDAMRPAMKCCPKALRLLTTIRTSARVWRCEGKASCTRLH